MVRRALLIANGAFADDSITALQSPVPDANRLRDLISREDVGSYEVTVCADADFSTARRTIQRFFDSATFGDTNLVLISGHGIKDQDGILHFATRDTELDALNATSVESRFVLERMNASAASQQILFIDTCFSGAFAKGTVNKSVASVTRADFGKSDAMGKAIITASTSIQFAGENDRHGSTQSVFNHHLIEGIGSGAADPTDTGEITLSSLFEYVRNALKKDAPSQTPQPYFYGLDGSVVIARNPAFKPAALPEGLTKQIANKDRSVRAAAIEDLIQFASRGARESELALAALRLLEQDDSFFVRHMAGEAMRLVGLSGGWGQPVCDIATTKEPEVSEAASDNTTQLSLTGVPDEPEELAPATEAGESDGWASDDHSGGYFTQESGKPKEWVSRIHVLRFMKFLSQPLALGAMTVLGLLMLAIGWQVWMVETDLVVGPAIVGSDAAAVATEAVTPIIQSPATELADNSEICNPLGTRWDIAIANKNLSAATAAKIRIKAKSDTCPILWKRVRIASLPDQSAEPPPPRPIPNPVPLSCNVGPYIVFFDFDKSDITAEAASILDNAVSAYSKCNSTGIMIAAHTDRYHPATYSMGLSQREATSIRTYLASRGIPESVMTTQAFGEKNPRIQTPDGVRELQNRRAEITFGPDR